MNRSQFSKTAHAAIKDGINARDALAKDHANRFLNGAHDFDPRVLTKLGNDGMKHFIQNLQADGIKFDSPKITERKSAVLKKNGSEPTEQGWSHQQRLEPNWPLRAIMHGTVAGTAFFLCGIAVLANLTS